ncbi:ATP-dependent RNA helicase DEAH12, chloroplastic-like [Apium graveolens]|uniref:ATP-dependent RNA helicase DEAH12, chloroplastic-like n=1 Tax=Apium graveolens TaxID=4045 RepID=UPI003D7A8FFC
MIRATAQRYAPPPSPMRNTTFDNHDRWDRSGDQEKKPVSRVNFVIQVRCDDQVLKRNQVNELIEKLKCTTKKFTVLDRDDCVLSFFFDHWMDAREAVVVFWKIRFEGTYLLVPKLISNVYVPSDTEELDARLKPLFIDRIKELIDGELVKKWQMKLREVVTEIISINRVLAKPQRLIVSSELTDRKKRFVKERDYCAKRVKEFKSAMQCIINYLEGKEEEGEVIIFKLKGKFDWQMIDKLITRECRRIEDGLPIYSFRQDILKQINREQVLVMIGETGSGKSTQLAQYLADSGVASTGSILCTQPRKLAAMSLAQRVKEECHGCYQDASIIYYPAFSTFQQYGSNVIYTTDNCLLQHYLNDKILSRISCIIVDEAHERSLNTDLLLGLLKKLLDRRHDLRLIIMSATIDANQLAEYFFGCKTFHVVGRNFPVEIRYVPCLTEGSSAMGTFASYVYDVLRMVTDIHRSEEEGSILAFLTSQIEVEWACEKFDSPSAVALALHGKLTFEDQARVFHNYPGKRKIIFTTNLAETSLTIPGVKYVVDSGMMKECRFEPSTGMNVLKVCKISQSSANQRAGRAGRTEPGRCYRLYSEDDFGLMSLHQEPEILRVHLGIAVLRILSLGISDVQCFDFVDAPTSKAIDMAVQNLVQLGAVTGNNDAYELTADGRKLVSLGIEPRLGKMILSCSQYRLGREGLVLAAVMTNSNSIFCRIGTEENKLKSDRLKVQFCHCDGDLFTLLSVYREWESLPPEKRNSWCWDNSINAKSMKRCLEMVKELECCLQNELQIIVQSYWTWTPLEKTRHDIDLKKAILSSLSENVAMYSGSDKLGYEVALTGKNIQLHPSCSLRAFSERPSWVVFGEILSVNNQYLVCVNAVEIESLDNFYTLPFDASEMGRRKLQMRALKGLGRTLLKRFCGKYNSNLMNLVSRIKIACGDERIGVEVNVDLNEILLFASFQDIEKVNSLVIDAVEYERKRLENECVEKCLYIGGRGVSPPVALFGAGAEIRHLELKERHLSIDVFHSDVNDIDDRQLVTFLERSTSSSVCSLHKLTGNGKDTEEKGRWIRVTFLSPEAAEEAVMLNGANLMGSLLKVVPVRSTYGSDHKFSFPAVKAKVHWPRRMSRGFGILKCDSQDVSCIVDDLSNLIIGGNFVRCDPSEKTMDSVVVGRLDKELSETEIYEILCTSTNRRILDFFLIRGESVEDPPCATCEEALLREITPFMPKRNSHVSSVHIQVFPPQPNDTYTKALITFDGSMHLEAAKALEQIEGKVLPGCRPWQKIQCQQLFHSFVSCPSSVYAVIKEQLKYLLSNLRKRKGVQCTLDRNENGSYRVKLSANATRVVAELRRPLEQLMRGKKIDHPGLTPPVLQLLFSREGISLMMSIQRETGTFILFDRQCPSIRVFGSLNKIELAQEKLVQSLLTLHNNKQLEVHLRGSGLPPDLMKKVVKKFGPDLHSLKEAVPGAELTLNTRNHIIYIQGGKQEKQMVEEIVHQIAQTSPQLKIENDASCPICLCEVEDGFRLEACGHEFCRSCLVEQCESAIKSQDSFPMYCSYQGCSAVFLIADLKSLLSIEKLDELFRASVGAFVAASGGLYRFCPSPDCPSIYRAVVDPECDGTTFFCGACSVETCTKCHLEYHPYISCEKYKEFKEDPDSSLKEWCKGKEHVKCCPLCGFTIEKVEGCNHVACRCGRHICWACLESFDSSDDCYNHLRSIHEAII